MYVIFSPPALLRVIVCASIVDLTGLPPGARAAAEMADASPPAVGAGAAARVAAVSVLSIARSGKNIGVFGFVVSVIKQEISDSLSALFIRQSTAASFITFRRASLMRCLRLLT